MGAVLSILGILLLLKAIFGLWLLVKAYEVSFGWFLFLLLLGLVFGGLGPLLTWIALGAVLLFVVNYWHAVRTPFLLLLAANAVHTVIVVQAGRTLAEQQKQDASEQVRQR